MRLIHPGANFLARVAARVPRLKIEVRRGSYLNGYKIAWDDRASKLCTGRHERNHAILLLREGGELAGQLSHIFPGRKRIASRPPDAGLLSLYHAAVDLRCSPEHGSRRHAGQRG